MSKETTVSVELARRGSVTAGPLTLKFGTNVVSESDFREFMKGKLGRALFKQKLIYLTPEPVVLPDESEAPTVYVSPSDASEADEDKGQESSDEDKAPSLAYEKAKDAVEFVKGLEDIDVLLACHEQDSRKTVQKACETRAEELEKK